MNEQETLVRITNMTYQILTSLKLFNRNHSTKINRDWFHNLYMQSPSGLIYIGLCDSLDDLMETNNYDEAIRHINLMSNIELFDYLLIKIKDTIHENLKSAALESMYHSVNNRKISEDVAFEQMFEVIGDVKYLQTISK